MSEPGGDVCSSGFEPLTDCDLVAIETHVNSLEEELAERIKAGDVLRVALQLSGDATVVVVKYGGQVAGRIASPQVRQIPEWIIRGTDYIATVLGKENGQLRVRITAIE